MVKSVMVQKFEASDGRQFSTRAAATLHEWRENPVQVRAVNVKFLGITYDLHGTVWNWSCGRCKKKSDRPIDTVLRFYSAGCKHCEAHNTFDFSEELDKLPENTPAPVVRL